MDAPVEFVAPATTRSVVARRRVRVFASWLLGIGMFGVVVDGFLFICGVHFAVDATRNYHELLARGPFYVNSSDDFAYLLSWGLTIVSGIVLVGAMVLVVVGASLRFRRQRPSDTRQLA